ncbi:hypothetical protein GJAV_G00071860 [Gymnothorax javanicus]|nr:hypothetical protein GJAV_G00071860 [Gymnothorax javanicus]
MSSPSFPAFRRLACLIKREDIEESIEEKNGYGMSSEEELVLSNIKEEEEEGGERQSMEVKRENGVNDEDVERSDLSPKTESESDVKIEAQNTGGISDFKVEEKESSSVITDCFLKQSTVPSTGSPVIAPREGNTGKMGKFSCAYCGKRFQKLYHLIMHKRIHKGERLYHFSQCCKSFQAPSNLEEHKRNHTGERPYHCLQCEKSFIRKPHLNIHQLTHTGERPYHCFHCEKSFIINSALKVHLQTHAGERLFHCSQCVKSLICKSYLNVHQ